MVRNTEIIIDACEFFLTYNNVFIGYLNISTKRVGKKKHIYINGLKVNKCEIGSIIYSFVEQKKPFKKKWATMEKDLCETFLFIVTKKQYEN